MNSKPVIGIPCRKISDPEYQLVALGQYSAYTKAIEKVGGLPLLIPLVDDHEEMVTWAATHCDGFILAGGEDIEPARYHAERSIETKQISPSRDSLELALLQKCWKEKIPLLGICRGLQLMNVGLGGTLIQDITSEHKTSVEHDSPENWWHCLGHQVNVVAGSRLHKITNLRALSQLSVNTIHHQAIEKLAQPLTVSASCPDDQIIEAVESEAHPFFLGVQWHPEVLWQVEDASVADPSLALFRALVEAARIYRDLAIQ